MRIRSLESVTLLSLLALVMGVAGCKHQAAAVRQPPPPPPTAAPPPASPTVNLQASPLVVQQGESAMLTWSSTNATSLNLAPGVGNVDPQGTRSVTPSGSVTYTITATGPGGSADASVHVTVSAAAPPVSSSGQPSMEELFTREVQDAFFDLDKADIQAAARDALSKTAQFLRSYPQVKVTVEGHCDERGSTEYNLALGDRRAQSAKDYLVSLGIAGDRMQTVSYGKERPFCTTHDEACWHQNRRAHFVLAK
jgi:peptidoglycan-associated lipoprotein